MSRRIKTPDERNASRRKHQEMREENRKKTLEIAKQLMAKLREVVKNCGLKESQVADYGGVDPSTVAHIMRRYHQTARFSSVVGMLRAAGAHLEVVMNEPKKDEFRAERRFAPPAIEEK